MKGKKILITVGVIIGLILILSGYYLIRNLSYKMSFEYKSKMLDNIYNNYNTGRYGWSIVVYDEKLYYSKVSKVPFVNGIYCIDGQEHKKIVPDIEARRFFIDGDSILYSNNDGIYLWDLKSKKETLLLSDKSTDFLYKDGMIYYTVFVKEGDGLSNIFNLYKCSLSNINEAQLLIENITRYTIYDNKIYYINDTKSEFTICSVEMDTEEIVEVFKYKKNGTEKDWLFSSIGAFLVNSKWIVLHGDYGICRIDMRKSDYIEITGMDTRLDNEVNLIGDYAYFCKLINPQERWLFSKPEIHRYNLATNGDITLTVNACVGGVVFDDEWIYYYDYYFGIPVLKKASQK